MNQARTPAESRRTSEMSLAMWLQNGRAAKGMSLDDVARVTKIQPRILERLEAGKLDGLPAEVFVRGFVRSFARCVGLDENEALKRYSACAPKATAATNAARAMVEAMGDLAPKTRGQAPKTLEPPPEILPQGSLEMPATEAVVEPEIFAEASDVISVPVAKVDLDDLEVEIVYETEPADDVVLAPPPDPVPAAEKKLKRKRGAAPKRRRKAAGTPSEATPVVADSAATVVSEAVAEAAQPVVTESAAKPVVTESVTGITSPTVTAPVVEAVVTEVARPKRTRKKKSTEVPPPKIAAARVTDTPVATAPVVVSPVATLVDPIAASSVGAPVVNAAVVASVDIAIDAALSPGLAASTAARAKLGAGDEAWVSDLWASEMSLPIPAVTDTEPSHDDPPEAATTRFERFDDVDFTDAAIPPAEADLSADLAGSWIPTMPPVVTTTAPAPWRRPNYAAAPALVAVIDDADPDSAERALEDRRSNRESRRTFLPPILLDREGDRSARQGGLTLAVIILLIAGALTLSYLMRRPSATGDGVTRVDTEQTLDTLA